MSDDDENWGGKRPGAGRPRSAEPRDVPLQLKLTKEEADELREAAAPSGEPVGTWARKKLVALVERLLERRRKR